MDPSEMKRAKLFAMIINSDEDRDYDRLFNRVDEYLRSVGSVELADKFIKLSRDVATEHFDDSFITDARDFGELDNVANVIPGKARREISDDCPIGEDDVSADVIIAVHEVVTAQRFSIFRDIAEVLKTHGSDLSHQYASVVAEYEAIVTPSPAQEAKVAPSTFDIG